MNSPFSRFQQVLCIGLADNSERRQHIRSEFQSVLLENYRFIDAYPQDSDAVAELFGSDFVAKYPPCFRCGRDSCECANKRLFPAQVANWMSHRQAWRTVASDSGSGLSLICEDDVKFLDGAHAVIHMVFGSEDIQASLDAGEPVLVRLGWAWSADHEDQQPPRLVSETRMSNPCYAINAAMGRILVDSLERIETTSDVYVHRLIGTRVDHYTAIPPAAYELSWSTGELRSEIRPKQERVDYLRRRLQSLATDSVEYGEVKKAIEIEQQGISSFDEFNSNPETKPFTR